MFSGSCGKKMGVQPCGRQSAWSLPSRPPVLTWAYGKVTYQPPLKGKLVMQSRHWNACRSSVCYSGRDLKLPKTLLVPSLCFGAWEPGCHRQEEPGSVSLTWRTAAQVGTSLLDISRAKSKNLIIWKIETNFLGMEPLASVSLPLRLSTCAPDSPTPPVASRRHLAPSLLFAAQCLHLPSSLNHRKL